ncbi:hypothetical protein [Kitasatospora sp. MBT63]|uniref:hypothetical protein n=1 Tax=Kitasatospora sp. MBT63 TaxID=1444768 RepID=UPI00068FD654|nr:hypothetical protein [Kitasatospora sp. MBT63]
MADTAKTQDTFVPGYVEPTPDQLARLAEELSSLAWKHALEISQRLSTTAPEERAAASQHLRWTTDWTLSILRMLREVGPAAEAAAAEIARRAGSQGASYVQLGEAWAITRQSARAKWPKAISASRPLTLQTAGGSAQVSYREDGSGWTWAAVASNGVTGKPEACYGTSEEALAHAGHFLLANATDVEQ